MRTQHSMHRTADERVEHIKLGKLSWLPYMWTTLAIILTLTITVRFSSAEFNRDEVLYTGFWLVLLTLSLKVSIKLKNFKFEGKRPSEPPNAYQRVKPETSEGKVSELVFQVVGLFFRVIIAIIQMLMRRTFWHNLFLATALFMIAICLGAARVPETLAGWQYVLVPALPMFYYKVRVVFDHVTRGRVNQRRAESERRMREALTGDIPIVPPSMVQPQPVL